jgi:hypothetical protein
MFVTKRYHNSVIKHLEEKLELSKALCDFQERQYMAQISDLRKLVFPQSAPSEISKEAREFDAVISASEKPPEMSEAEMTKILAGAREIDLLISGNYDQDLLN